MDISIKTKTGKKYKLDMESSDGVDSIETNIKDNESTLRVETKTGKKYKLDVESSDGVDSIETNIKDNDSTFRVVLRSEGVKQILRSECVKQINVETPLGNKFRLKVESSDKIESVMKKLPIGTPHPQMRLIFGGKELERVRTLADYNIQNNSTLHLVFPTSGPVKQIFVRTLTGRNICLNVENSNRIESVMEKIESVLGHPPEQQRLIICGTQLDIERGKTLAEYSIQNDCTLYVLSRLRG